MQIKFYSSALPPPIAMFVKREKKQTLVENLEEYLKVENDLVSNSNHLEIKKLKLPHIKRMVRRIKGHPKQSHWT